VLCIIPQRATLVAGLVLKFTSDNVENKCITWYFLVCFNLNNVAGLDAAPVGDLEALVPLGEDKLLNRFLIYFLSRLLELSVMQKVEEARDEYACHSYASDMRVCGSISLS
jgi:hypothetical protein